jgi:hypothetical protein
VSLERRFRDWIHEQPFSLCGPGADECPDWPMARELAAIAESHDELLSRRLLAALREARPYVYNRIDPRKPEEWRTQTAKGVLERVDAAIAAGKRRTPAAVVDEVVLARFITERASLSSYDLAVAIVREFVLEGGRA